MKVKSIAGLIMVGLMATGCDKEQDIQAVAPKPVASPPSFDDVFNLVIETERHVVRLDNALDGGFQKAMTQPVEERSDIYRVDYALRQGVRQLLSLRDSACIDGIAPDVSCKPLDLPDWVSAPPDVLGTSFTEYQARSEWLSEAMAELVATGCRAGMEATGDDMFCAVE